MRKEKQKKHRQQNGNKTHMGEIEMVLLLLCPRCVV